MRSRMTLREQLKVEQMLVQAEVELLVQIARVRIGSTRVRDTVALMVQLTRIAAPRLPEFETIVSVNSDYSTHHRSVREKIAELAGLAQAVAAIIACPILDEDGGVTLLSDDAVRAGSALVSRIGR